MTKRIVQLSILSMWFVSLVACGGRPTKTLTEAETALSRAILAKKCAPDEYKAAEAMYAKAKKLADEEKYDESANAAAAAKILAEKAEAKAAERREECLKPKDSVGGVDPNSLIDPTMPDPNAIAPDQLETVYFDYNAATPTPEAKRTMSKNAAWLNARPDQQVTLQGHCDERGSTEYNLALGEQRAKAVRTYLKTLGVDISRLNIVSYGEEMPVQYGGDESSFARNRRVEFVIR